MKHQLKEDIRDQYIYGVLEDSGERIMPSLDELIKKHNVPSSTLYRISSKEEWKLQRKQFQSKLRQESGLSCLLRVSSLSKSLFLTIFT